MMLKQNQKLQFTIFFKPKLPTNNDSSVWLDCLFWEVFCAAIAYAANYFDKQSVKEEILTIT